VFGGREGLRVLMEVYLTFVQCVFVIRVLRCLRRGAPEKEGKRERKRKRKRKRGKREGGKVGMRVRGREDKRERGKR
jgi:hypothetical protein